MHPSENLRHDRISPTAKLVAYWRQFCDIPFSKDVIKLFDVDATYNTIFKGLVAEQHNVAFISLLELRYRCIGHLLNRLKIHQILEFASGISLRGLAMTSDPAITYVESDLPGLTEEKLKIVHRIMETHSIPPRPNLFFHSANILYPQEIEPILRHFKKDSPLAIVHEGLFQYLTRAEKETAAKNILPLLQEFGGVWITPDLDTRTRVHHHLLDPSVFQGFLATIEQVTGRNFEANAFENDEDIHTFFHKLGFFVEFVPQLDDDLTLVSLKEASSPLKEALQQLRLALIRPL